MNTCASTCLEATIAGKTFHFPLPHGSVYRIGRNADSEIPVADSGVSRNHAILQHANSGYLYLTDLGSRNGTLLNGRRITAPVELQRGDLVTIGDQKFVLHQHAARRTAGLRPDPEATSIRLQTQLVTVLVADIRGYTEMARRLGEARISQIIGAFMREAGAIFERHGSWEQKYIGDAGMAVWVHPNQTADPAELLLVLRALSDLFEIVEGLQGKFGLEEPVRIGAGINTGRAVTGNMGSTVLADHTALGDGVNKAFRLESATRELDCDIAVGQTTAKILCAGGMMQSATVRLKGYEEPEQISTLQKSALPFLCQSFESTAY